MCMDCSVSPRVRESAHKGSGRDCQIIPLDECTSETVILMLWLKTARLTVVYTATHKTTGKIGGPVKNDMIWDKYTAKTRHTRGAHSIRYIQQETRPMATTLHRYIHILIDTCSVTSILFLTFFTVRHASPCNHMTVGWTPTCSST